MAGPEIWDVALIPPPTLVRNGLKPLARCVLIPLGLTAVTAATDAAIRKKNFRSAIHPKTQTKYLEQNREIQQQWTGHEKFDIYFLMFFHSLCQSFISGRGTGYWAMSPPKLEIFLIFPYFLRSLVLSRSATREETLVPSLLYYNHFHNILRPSYVSPNFSFTTSETMHDYYL